ncbi:MAG: caspase family protein [Desulfococcaceae bacterium]
MKNILIFIILFTGISGTGFASAQMPDLFHPIIPDTGKRSYKALIIGINYNDLLYPENDAKALAGLLKEKYGFQEPILLTGSENTTKQKIVQAVETLIRDSREEDSILIYYSGHGSLDKKKNEGWWIPSDARNRDKSTWLSNNWLRDQISRMKARHVLLIADACYAGTIYPYERTRGDEINDKFYREKYKSKSRFAMTSAGAKEEASDKEIGQNSVFAHFLINTLETNTKPYLCTDELYYFFAPRVSDRLTQTPRLGVLDFEDHQGGQFIFWTQYAKADAKVKTDAGKYPAPSPGESKANADDLPLPAGTANSYALLIGIEEYQGSGLISLAGSGNDIDLIREVLKNRYEFDDKNIIVLKNRNAGHSAIEQAFSDLAGRVRPGDRIYIHYSGHGSCTPNLDEQEPEKNDQTWVSYGSRCSDKKEKDNYDILDDEINEWLIPILSKTELVVFVSDSCHSASVCRGEDAPLIRAAPADTREHLLGRNQFSSSKSYNAIFIGAAQDDESAAEFRTEDDKAYGMFTWFWAQTLQQAQPGETWHDLFQRVRIKVTERRGSQHPQIKGSRNMPVFGGEFKPAPPRIPVIKVNADELTAVIGAGTLTGIAQGSVFRKYDPRMKNTADLPLLTIRQTRPFDSLAEISGKMKPGDLVVEESHAYDLKPIPVFLNADFPLDADRSLMQQLQAVLKERELSAFIPAADQKACEMLLYVLRPKKEKGEYIRKNISDTLPRSFPDQPPEVWILTDTEKLLNENLRISFKDPQKGMEMLKRNLKKIARIRDLKKLASETGPKTEFRTIIWEPAYRCPESDPDCLHLPDGRSYQKQGEYHYREMEGKILSSENLLTFAVKNLSDKSCYVYFIDITPDGKIQAVFPTMEDNQEDALIRPLEERDYREVAALASNQAGEETVKIIVTELPIDVALLESEGFARDEKKEMNPLEKLLSNAMDGTRGEVIRIRNAQWGTMQYSFQVK